MPGKTSLLIRIGDVIETGPPGSKSSRYKKRTKLTSNGLLIPAPVLARKRRHPSANSHRFVIFNSLIVAHFYVGLKTG